jgi:hypothetical protein
VCKTKLIRTIKTESLCIYIYIVLPLFFYLSLTSLKINKLVISKKNRGSTIINVIQTVTINTHAGLEGKCDRSTYVLPRIYPPGTYQGKTYIWKRSGLHTLACLRQWRHGRRPVPVVEVDLVLLAKARAAVAGMALCTPASTCVANHPLLSASVQLRSRHTEGALTCVAKLSVQVIFFILFLLLSLIF